ncbi:MAG: cellulase family glycosylhydrolase [Planctomycetia bacterium]|nr:cellulase family glycosylhydrolase [Planctomycetia bacterium]
MKHPLSVLAVGSLFFMTLVISGPSCFSQTEAITDYTREVEQNCFKPLGLFPQNLWRLQTGDQSCVSSFSPLTTPDKLVVDFEFTATPQIEYLAISTPLRIDQENVWLGFQVTAKDTAGRELHPYWIARCVDPSGETHSVRLDDELPGDWCVGKVASSPGHWGGDEDGVLQLPCRVECFLMDRERDGWKQQGQLTLTGFQFFSYDKNAMAPMITATAPAAGNPANLLTPGEASGNYDITLAPVDEFKEKAVQLKIERQINGVTEPATIMEQFAGQALNITRPVEPGFEAVRITPFVQEGSETRLGQPLKFSFAVLPEKVVKDPWFGVCTHLQTTPMEAAARAGLGMVRDDMPWASVEKEKGVYQFPESFDKYVDRATELGLEPLLIINYGNKLYDEGDFPHSDEAVAAYARYAGEVAKHFKGRCRYYEIWNEWTGGCGMGRWMKNAHNTPENYLKLIKAASEAIREVDSNAFIVGGGGDHYTYHFEEIQKEMELGVMNWCDAYSVHPYIYPANPRDAQMKENMTKIVELMKANGCEHPRLWLTELGWPTHTILSKEEAIRGSSFTLEDYSASMLVQSAVVYRSIPEVTNYFWYDLQNDGTEAKYNEHNFGLVHNAKFQFQPKASLAALACVTQILVGSKVDENQDLTTETRTVYTITRPDGSRVLVAWTHGDSEDFLPENTVRRVGLYGNELTGDDNSLTTRPVWYFLK